MVCALRVTAAALVLAAASLITVAGLAPSAESPVRLLRRHHVPTPATPALARRGADTTNASFTSLWYAAHYTNGAQPPDYISGDSAGQKVIIGGDNATDNNSPVSSCPIAYIGGSAVSGSETTGWKTRAQVVDFDIVNLTLSTTAMLPFYLERKDMSTVKRIVIVLQGDPRDTWRYANLMRYAGLCAVANSAYDVDFGDYAIAAPMLWNTNDTEAGGATSDQVVWSGSQWANGGLTRLPEGASYTTFTVLDKLITSFFNQTDYPALTSVVVAGHSAGALLTQRYAMLREVVDGEDSNMKWWISNAGSYVWPVDSRPVEDPTAVGTCDTCEITPACDAKKNDWPFGLNITDIDTMSVYARSRFKKGDKAEILKAYLDRRVQYTYAENDTGAGDTHCQAQYQGDSHITRGRNLAAVLATLDAPNHVVTYVVNATHVDEEMYIDYTTQAWIFNDALNDARNASSNSSSSSSSSSTGSSHKSSGVVAKTAGRALLNGSLIALGSVVLVVAAIC